MMIQIRRCGDVAEVVLGIVGPSCDVGKEATTYPNAGRMGTLDSSIRNDKCFQVQLPESMSAMDRKIIRLNNNAPPPDEESKAFGDKDESNKVAFSSGSNYSTSSFSTKRSYDESEGFTFTTLSDNMEEEDDHEEEEPVMPSKRRRSSEVHSLSERRRREKINKKMRALQDLLPNCTKVDKASMLAEAIDYLKTLQIQLQAMSTGCYLPSMMLMGRLPPQFTQMGLPPPPPQFLTTSPMLQGLSMPVPPHPPFYNPLFRMPCSSFSSFTQSVPVNNNLFQHLGDGLMTQSNHQELSKN